MKNYLNVLFFFLLLLASACQESTEEHTADATTYTCPMHPQVVQHAPGTCPICGMDLVPVSQSGKNSGELMLSENQIALGNIKASRVKQGQLANNTILAGKLVLDETQTDIISSRVAGRVERLFVKETGQRITKGQPLYALYAEPLLVLQQEYLLALKQHEALGKENPRFATLLEAARQKLLRYGLTAAQLNALAKGGTPTTRVTFVAPESGVVTEVAATEGQYVSEGSVLYRLSRLDEIWVEAELYAQELANVQPGDKLTILVQGATTPLTATVSFLSPEFRQGSQVVILRASLANKDNRFKPGMQASVLLPTTGDKTLLVPTDAIIRDEHGTHVWVQTGPDTFKARSVVLGEEGEEQVAVLKGLKLKDKVVTSGAYLLYSEFVLKKGANPVAHQSH